VAQLRRRSRQSIPTERFFTSRGAAAAFKHAILGYITPFAAKTGSTSAGNRVVIIDGYAGAGRYDNGQPGSPSLIAAAARGLRNRSLEGFFVEKDPQTFERLRAVLAEEDHGEFKWKAWQGTVEQHLDELLEQAAGVPLFVFLDPFGLGLPFDVIAGIFTQRQAGRFAPATEVLFRFDADAIRRIRGVLGAEDYPARAGQISALDRAAGGTWWRDENDLSMDNAAFADWFMWRLLKEFSARANCWGWVTPVRQRQGQQPAYYLAFLTRHSDGLEVFAEIMSLANEKWRRTVFEEAAEDAHARGQLLLDYADDFLKDEEALLAEQWRARLEDNVRSLLASHESFVVRERLGEVFAGVLGQARQKHLREALKRLHGAGVTSSDSKGADLYGKRVVRAGAQSASTENSRRGPVR
jgi:three-Cys-motif partner protein